MCLLVDLHPSSFKLFADGAVELPGFVVLLERCEGFLFQKFIPLHFQVAWNGLRNMENMASV